MKSYHIQLTEKERHKLEILKEIYGQKSISKVIRILIKKEFLTSN